jgi:hypothetical protein
VVLQHDQAVPQSDSYRPWSTAAAPLVRHLGQGDETDFSGNQDDSRSTTRPRNRCDPPDADTAGPNQVESKRSGAREERRKTCCGIVVDVGKGTDELAEADAPCRGRTTASAAANAENLDATATGTAAFDSCVGTLDVTSRSSSVSAIPGFPV